MWTCTCARQCHCSKILRQEVEHFSHNKAFLCIRLQSKSSQARDCQWHFHVRRCPGQHAYACLAKVFLCHSCTYFYETIVATQSDRLCNVKLTLRHQLQTLNNLVWIPRCLARPLSLYFNHSASCHYFQVDLSGPTYRLAVTSKSEQSNSGREFVYLQE